MTEVLYHNKMHKHTEDQMLMSLHAPNNKIIKICNQELQAVERGKKNKQTRKMLTSRVQPLPSPWLIPLIHFNLTALVV